MPDLFDDKEEDLDSSSSSETLDEATDAKADGADAESSPAEGVTEDSTLSIVRDVVGEKDTSEAASPAEGQEGKDDPSDPKTNQEPDDENFSDVPFHKHPRFQKLLRERNDFKVDASRYQNVQDFMDTHGIDAEEAADGFVIMGLMKTNPQAAWEKLKPHVQKLLIAAGEVLPDDLAERVRKGELTEDAAFRINRAEAMVETVKHGQSFAEQQEERRRELAHFNSLRTTANDWEQDRLQKDPNFPAKQIPLRKELLFLQSTEGKPNTPEGVLDHLKRAYAAVSIPVQAQPPARRPQAPRLPASGNPSGNPRPKPETNLDIVRSVTRNRA